MADYRAIPNEEGFTYEFYCDLSGAKVISVKTSDGVSVAWEQEGKQHFNQCSRCHRWVIDAMYNPDLLCCVECVPIEEYPDYCPHCGAKTNDVAYFCHICGTRLLYGGEIQDETANAI